MNSNHDNSLACLRRCLLITTSSINSRRTDLHLLAFSTQDHSGDEKSSQCILIFREGKSFSFTRSYSGKNLVLSGKFLVSKFFKIGVSDVSPDRTKVKFALIDIENVELKMT